MDFSSYFPIWNKLTPTQQQILERNAVLRKVDKGTVIHNGTVECTGLLLVRSGQLRAYIISDEGREISLYRLFDRDICLFSASCMMNSIQFEPPQSILERLNSLFELVMPINIFLSGSVLLFRPCI